MMDTKDIRESTSKLADETKRLQEEAEARAKETYEAWRKADGSVIRVQARIDYLLHTGASELEYLEAVEELIQLRDKSDILWRTHLMVNMDTQWCPGYAHIRESTSLLISGVLKATTAIADAQAAAKSIDPQEESGAEDA